MAPALAIRHSPVKMTVSRLVLMLASSTPDLRSTVMPTMDCSMGRGRAASVEGLRRICEFAGRQPRDIESKRLPCCPGRNRLPCRHDGYFWVRRRGGVRYATVSPGVRRFIASRLYHVQPTRNAFES